MKKCMPASLVLAVTVTGSAWAHHNMSATFDFNQRFTRSGTLTELDWRNPHIYLTVDTRNEQGEMETWSFEGPSPSFFRERDVGKTDFEASVGREVSVQASRARDGSLSGLIRQIELADGTTASLCPQNC